MAGIDAEVRVSAKVLVVDLEGRVLLFRGCDPGSPDSGTWWFPPGGGVESGETIAEAAVRELWEDTGLKIDDVGGEVYFREETFTFKHNKFLSRETYFAVRVPNFEVDDSRWTDDERESIVDRRWWTVEALRTTPDTYFPSELVALVEQPDHPSAL